MDFESTGDRMLKRVLLEEGEEGVYILSEESYSTRKCWQPRVGGGAAREGGARERRTTTRGARDDVSNIFRKEDDGWNLRSEPLGWNRGWNRWLGSFVSKDRLHSCGYCLLYIGLFGHSHMAK